MDVIKVEWNKTKPSLNQIYSRGFEMALVGKNKDDSLVQATPFVLCKDYFQDAVNAQINNKKQAIYGFSYNPETCPPVMTDRIRLAIGNAADSTLGEKIPSILDLLNQAERKLKLIRSKAFSIETPHSKYEGKGGNFLIEGSIKWMIAPPMLSLYTLLVRLGLSHKIGKDFWESLKDITENKTTLYASGTSGSNDVGYLKQAMPVIKKIFEFGYTKIFYLNAKDNYPNNIPVEKLHNSFGIVGLATNSCASEMPYWVKDPSKKKPKKKPTAVSEKKA